MTPDDILAWAGFFDTVAQVGATLAGLIFVGLTISLNYILKADGYLARAFAALFVQFELLIIAVSALIPGQPVWVLGLEFIATGLAFFVAITLFARKFRETGADFMGGRSWRAGRIFVTSVATLSPAVAGVLLIAGAPYAMYFVVPSMLASGYLSIAYAWVFAVEIPRRSERTPPPH
ncbi:MAG TPA: hypothetical protein VL026_05435 [Rhizomicrobium sp.]|nr:hypothetical protein [Rhizomicrobium sp.]